MDPQRHSQRVRVGLILLGALLVVGGYLGGAEWFAGAIGMVG